jgi:hypothetical protein
LMYVIADKNPQQAADLAQIMQSVPWRMERFSEEILNTLHKNK